MPMTTVANFTFFYVCLRYKHFVKLRATMKTVVLFLHIFVQYNISLSLYIYIYIYIYEDHKISFQTFSVWALLLIVKAWNSSPLRSNLLLLQCTCCTVPKTSGRLPSKSSCVSVSMTFVIASFISQLSHNDSL